jgi:hypothetical protein
VVVTPVRVQGSEHTSPGFPAANVVDGNPETRWETATNRPAEAWLAFDLGSPRALTKLRWYAGTPRWSQFFQIQRSDDGQTWTTIDGAVNLGGGQPGWREHGLNGATARYVRLLFTNQPGPDGQPQLKFAVNEIEIHAAPS